MDNESEIEKLARMIKSEFDSVRSEVRDGFAAVNERFEKADKRIDLLDQKIDRVDAKLDQHRQETKDGFAGIHRFIGGISTTLADHEQRIKELEGE